MHKKKHLRLENLEDRHLLTTFVVTNSLDAGEGSLRQAILDANANVDVAEEAGPDRIEFQIESGTQSIQPITPLPPIQATVVVDGTTQPGFDGKPLVEVNGALLGEDVSTHVGLEIGWGVTDTVVRGLAINAFQTDAIRIRGDNSLIVGNFIGAALDDSGAAGSGKGILVSGSDNTIGGSDAADRNVVSGNLNGIWITGDSNTVKGNFIGTDQTGSVELGNTRSGIVVANVAAGTVIGGTEAGDGNVITSSGRYGVELESVAVVQQNMIGVGEDGTLLGNRLAGVSVAIAAPTTEEGTESPLAEIGGTEAQLGNVIAATSEGAGVRVTGDVPVSILGNQIFANVIAIDLGADGITENDQGDADTGPNNLQNFPSLQSSQLGSVEDPEGVRVTYRVESPMENTAYPLRVEFYIIDGNSASLLGWDEFTEENFSAPESKSIVFDQVVLGDRQIFASATDADGNTSEFQPVVVITGPTIPVDPQTYTVTNTSDTGEGSLRQAILSANDRPGFDMIEFQIGTGLQTIQPVTPLPKLTDAVLIDGRSQPGFESTPIIELDGSLLDGDAITHVGLEVDWAVNGATIQGLVVNSFQSDGLRIRGTGTTIVGNYLGTSADGTATEGNSKGVWIVGNSNVVGGTSELDRNVISGNINGVWLTGNDNVIQGNYIGTDATGLTAVANQRVGIVSVLPSEQSTIGGVGENEGNVISGNGLFGVELANPTTVHQNLIGVGSDGTTPLGNRFAGVVVRNQDGAVSNVQIGGTDENEGNVIAFSQIAGVSISNGEQAAGRISVLGNSIYGNPIGIDLGTPGITANDIGDGDSGDNRLQNYPDLEFTPIGEADAPTGVEVSYRVNSEVSNATYPIRVEFFLIDANGSSLIGWDEFTEENFNAENSKVLSFDGVIVGESQDITASATDAVGNTSEFTPSEFVEPTEPTEPTEPVEPTVLADPLEPNDTNQQPTEITAETQLTDLTLNTADDVDWFSWTADATDTLILNVNGFPGDIILNLFDSDTPDTPVDLTDLGFGDYSHPVEEGKTYLIQVLSPLDSLETYDLRLQLGIPEPPVIEVLGDFDGDQLVTTADIDLLFAAIADESTDAIFDLNEDSIVNNDDVTFMIEGPILNTLPGDANLDGVVDFPDFLAISANFTESNRGWAQGDFTGDGEVQFEDFLIVSRNFAGREA